MKKNLAVYGDNQYEEEKKKAEELATKYIIDMLEEMRKEALAREFEALEKITNLKYYSNMKQQLYHAARYNQTIRHLCKRILDNSENWG